MKRKLLILAPILATSTVALAASCTNKNDQTDKELAELKLRISRLNSDYATEKLELQKQLEALKARLSVEISDKDQKDSTIADLQKQLEELQKQVETAEGKKVKKNNLSARTLYGELVKFLAEDFPKTMQDQNPEAFNSNKDLFNRISESVKLSAEEFKTTPEDFKHVFTWQNAIFYNLNRAQLVAKFIDDPSNPVTVLTPKSQLMDELFNWRIKDLDRIIQELSYDSYKNDKKDELIAQVNDAKEKYQKAKDESSLFAHQIAKWFELERESSDETEGPIRDIVNFASPQYRSLLPKFNLPTFKISLFPVYRQIVDDEFKAGVKKELLELNDLYKSWLSNSGFNYIYSIRYYDLYKKAKVVTDTIKTIAQDSENINYYNEFNTWNDLKEFVNEAKLTLLDAGYVNYKSEKTMIDSLVDQQLNRSVSNTYAKMFINKYQSKSNSDDKDATYLWTDFFKKYHQLITQIFSSKKSTFVESYDRYAKYLILKKQVYFSEQLINLFKNLGENIEEPELKSLLRWDNSEKFDKQIKKQEEIVRSSKEFMTEIKNGIDKLKFNSQESNTENVALVHKNAVDFQNLLKTKLSNDGDWIYYFAGEEHLAEELQKIIDSHVALIVKLFEKQQKTSEDVKEINESHKKIVSKILGNSSDDETEVSTLFGKFNKGLLSENYRLVGDEYNKQISIFEEIIKSLKQEDGDLKSKVESILKKLETITEYGNDWYGLYFSSRDEIHETLNSKLKELLELNTTNKKEDLKNKTNEFISLIGDKSDGLVKKGLLSDLFELMENWESEIDNIKRRKQRSIETAKYVPGQELFVLLRYWNSKLLSKTQSSLPDEKTHPDKDLSKFLNKLFKDVVNKPQFKAITSVKGTDSYFDTEESAGSTPSSVYKEFKELEEKYAESILLFIKSSGREQSEAKKILQESRANYYNFLNVLRDKKIYLADQWIRFSADKYINNQGDIEHFVAATLLGFAADAYALSDMIDNFANKKFYEE
ncbi:Hypothetical protein, predicted lipoprotein [Mycoplasmopsis bovigenitalium 51080]|uniref:Lipoprotein n=1 Tax=Mycoplasmopsis bovigenitalium 51080 TaxID=1188235 RepID=N9VB97_9BACT|nr:hypothetical protein [Mycoplasmopsis bovigenitalium]ENY68958.1 Hypothetical protein, predicted lipoprotein [Mycoplasmopsis bovigenitalium 51080]